MADILAADVITADDVRLDVKSGKPEALPRGERSDLLLWHSRLKNDRAWVTIHERRPRICRAYQVSDQVSALNEVRFELVETDAAIVGRCIGRPPKIPRLKI